MQDQHQTYSRGSIELNSFVNEISYVSTYVLRNTLLFILIESKYLGKKKKFLNMLDQHQTSGFPRQFVRFYRLT